MSVQLYIVFMLVIFPKGCTGIFIPSSLSNTTKVCPAPSPCVCRFATQNVIDCSGQSFTNDSIPILIKTQQSFQKLNFSRNGLNDLPDNYFVNVTNAISLDLSKNMLEKVPDAVKALTGLTFLYLHGNYLNLEQENQWEQLSNIRLLVLHDNKIQTIQKKTFHGLSNLVAVILSRNAISTVETGAFMNTPHLKQLYLNTNSISSITKGMLQGLQKLTYLDLRQNDIMSIDDGAFVSLFSLKSLELTHNKISALNEQVFQGLSQLQNLTLENNNISALLPNTFSGLDSLTKLYLAYNHLDELNASVFNGIEDTLQELFVGVNLLRDTTSSFTKLSKLAHLELALNPISKLPNLAGLSQLHVLNIHNTSISQIYPCELEAQAKPLVLAWSGSPINCNCNLKWMLDWFLRSDIILTTENSHTPSVCVLPENLKGTKITELQSRDLVCENGEEPQWCNKQESKSMPVFIIRSKDKITIAWNLYVSVPENGISKILVWMTNIHQNDTKEIQLAANYTEVSIAASDLLQNEHYLICVKYYVNIIDMSLLFSKNCTGLTTTEYFPITRDDGHQENQWLELHILIPLVVIIAMATIVGFAIVCYFRQCRQGQGHLETGGQGIEGIENVGYEIETGAVNIPHLDSLDTGTEYSTSSV